MSFKGFKTVRYPIYTVVTPQTGDTYDVRTLNVSEVIKVRDSLITRNKLPKVMNEIIWDAVENSPDHIKTKEDFLNNLTIKDRDALIYGLYHCTFGEDKTYNVVCEDCNSDQKIKVNLNSVFAMNSYPGNKSVTASYRVARAKDPLIPADPVIDAAVNQGSKIQKDVPKPPEGMPESIARQEFPDYFEMLDAGELVDDAPVTPTPVAIEVDPPAEPVTSDIGDAEDLTPILSKLVKIVLPVTHVVCYIKQPTVKNESALFEDLTYNNQSQLDLASDTLIIDRFEEYDSNNNLVQVVKDAKDIVEAFQLLPYKDRNDIVEKFEKEFGQYDISLKAAWQCLSCAHQNQLELDVVNQFFRAITGS